MIHSAPLAMSDLIAARSQMTLSLMFHIVFSAIGIGLPLLMVLAEGQYLRTGRRQYLDLTRKWAKVTGLLFAVGAISGTALSFELGLLWPSYVQVMGASVGHLFALEGFAFFIEAIFIGLYLYGWDRMSPKAHWLCGVVVAASGMISGVLVLGVNAWMQLPVGVSMDAAGKVVGTRPMAIFATDAWWTMALHSTLASYLSVGFAMAAIYATGYLRGRKDDYHRTAIRLGLLVGGTSALLQMASGDLIAKFVSRNEPTKFAAMEAHYKTSRYAPIILGGLPNDTTEEVRYGIHLPGLLSFLATFDPSAEVKGLADFPRELWPNVQLVHLAFDMMVGSGSVLALVAGTFLVIYWRRRDQVFEYRWLLAAIVVGGFLGFIGLEAGWIVTEAGRQPWAIRGILKTADAVTPAGNIPRVFFAYSLLYLVLGATTLILIRRIIREAGHEAPKANVTSASAYICAVYALLGLMAYAVLAGADFGGGVWNLFASGERKHAQRNAIASAMGPVWEANHVWLIFVLVIGFTCFPRGYAVVMEVLFLPLHLVLAGIMLRGAAFVFHHNYMETRPRAEVRLRAWSVVFGVASLVSPLLFGLCFGVLTSGDIRIGSDGRLSVHVSWFSPYPIACAFLALSTCAYLAATYLVVATRDALRDDFRLRAKTAGTATAILAATVLIISRWDAPWLFAQLRSPRALPVLALGGCAFVLSAWAVHTRRDKTARACAAAQTVLILLGWGLAQGDHMIYPDVTLAYAAAPVSMLRFMLLAVPAGMTVLAPSLFLLFRVFATGPITKNEGSAGWE